MPTYIQDPDIQQLSTLSYNIQSDYQCEEDDIWQDSPFAWIRQRPSRQKGKIGEQLVAGWVASKGLNVTKSPDSDADMIIEGIRVEIKFSTLWKSGVYKFQQIRDQNYSVIVCLGISPFDASGWAIPKKEIMNHATPQHSGATGTDTKWLSVSPGSEPEWLRPWGGKLSCMYEVLLELCSRTQLQ